MFPPPPPGASGMGFPPPPGMPGMPPGMPGMPMMGMAARPGVPKPTKPVIRPVKKLQQFNWRRVLLVPKDAPGKKINLWDDITEPAINQEEFEELFENKVSFSQPHALLEKRSCDKHLCGQSREHCQEEDLL